MSFELRGDLLLGVVGVIMEVQGKKQLRIAQDLL